MTLDPDICILLGYDDVAKRFLKNCKVGDINVTLLAEPFFCLLDFGVLEKGSA